MRYITGDHPIWTGHGLIGGDDWIFSNPEARNGLWYGDWTKGQFALNGAPVGFSQLGTFTASGTRFEEQSSGLLTPRGANIPRLADHSTGARRWLMEGAVTNSVPHNVALDAVSYWTNGVGTSVSTPQPDNAGTLRAFTVSGNGFNRPSAAIPVTPGETYTVSEYVRNASGGAAFRVFDVTNATGIAVQPMTNGSAQWAREYHTFTAPAGCTEVYVYSVYFNAAAGSAEVFGLQFEPGDYPTSLIWTTGGTAARAADIFTSDYFAGVDLSGGFLVQIEGVFSANGRLIQLDAGGGANRLALNFSDSQQFVWQRINGASITGQGIVSSTEGFHKVGLLMTPDSSAMVVDGVVGPEDTSVEALSPDRLLLAASDTGTSAKPSTLSISKIAVSPPVSIAEVEERTSP